MSFKVTVYFNENEPTTYHDVVSIHDHDMIDELLVLEFGDSQYHNRVMYSADLVGKIEIFPED